MFDNQRFITRGIQIELPQAFQFRLWGLIDKRISENALLDYLQIYDLDKYIDEKSMTVQRIIHRQERPSYSKEYRLMLQPLIKTKIYIIDDGKHTVMMLAEEY